VNTPALLAEILLSGFFAIACFQARAEPPSLHSLAPARLFALTGRLERLRRSRWQWFCMVLLLALMRIQIGAPVVAELTVAAQFILFLALPSAKQPVEIPRA
jgi:hypothetical protein